MRFAATMSEVPEGLKFPHFERKEPRPSATLMITRDGQDGVEVLLGLRSESMPSFPGYWAFPGGGVSRVDVAASESLGISIAECAMFRELVEELGLAPLENKLVTVEDDFRMMVVDDKANWFPLALDGDIPCSNDGVRVISERTTPPFSPMRFENTFLHLHTSEHDEPSLTGQTEFTEVRWIRPRDLITAWKNHVIKVAPPVVTLLMEVDKCLLRMDENMEMVAIDLETRKPGRRSILFAHGVEVVPVRTATLPPADHTNCYLVGDPEGEYVLVDPAFHHREGMEDVAEAVDRHKGELKAIIFTHSHTDHIGDIGLIREAFDVPIWGSRSTSEAVECQRIIEDGEELILGSQTWKVIMTHGHCPGHICLISDAGLVAGDMVAGFGTILVPSNSGDMSLYISELEKLIDLFPHLMFPSHGPVIPLPEQKLENYIYHRKARHQRVLEAVAKSSNLEQITKLAYENTPDAHPGLALDQTLAHLFSHEKEGSVRRENDEWVIV